jgi:hypothetical protein
LVAASANFDRLDRHQHCDERLISHWDWEVLSFEPVKDK